MSKTATPENLTEARKLLTLADAFLEAFLDDEEIVRERFRKVSLRMLRSMTGIDFTGEEAIAALIVLQDEGHIQFSAPGATGTNIYVRWTTSDEDRGPFIGLCEPMSATDVSAVCAMVEGGISGTTELTGLKPGVLKKWSDKGIKTRPDARELLLSSVLARYADCGTRLASEPLTISSFVKKAKQAQKERRRRISAMRQAVADNPIIPEPEPEPITRKEPESEPEPQPEPIILTPEPEPEPEPETQEEDVPATEPQPKVNGKVKTCAKCAEREVEAGRRLCAICEDELCRQSGFGTVEPVAEDSWRSEAEMVVTQRLIARGLDELEAATIGEGAHLAFEGLKAHDMALEDAGIFIDGMNLGALEDQIRDQYAGRAVQANLRRNDGMVLAGGMELNPLRLREIVDQIDGTVREVDDMILRPLLEDLSADRNARAALGRDGIKALRTLQARVAKLRALAAELGVELVEEDPFDLLDKGD